METPTELMSLAREGSDEAFDQLVRLYQGRVRAYLRRYVFDRNVADDLAQETFLTLYQSLDKFKTEAPLDLWLLGVARNRVLKFLRDEAARRAHEPRTLESAVGVWLADRLQADSSGVNTRNGELVALKTCLEKLAPASGGMVSERYFERRSCAEIARKSGRRESSVRMTLLRIRRSLRDCVRLAVTTQEAGI